MHCTSRHHVQTEVEILCVATDEMQAQVILPLRLHSNEHVKRTLFLLTMALQTLILIPILPRLQELVTPNLNPVMEKEIAAFDVTKGWPQQKKSRLVFLFFWPHLPNPLTLYWKASPCRMGRQRDLSSWWIVCRHRPQFRNNELDMKLQAEERDNTRIVCFSYVTCSCMTSFEFGEIFLSLRLCSTNL